MELPHLQNIIPDSSAISATPHQYDVHPNHSNSYLSSLLWGPWFEEWVLMLQFTAIADK